MRATAQEWADEGIAKYSHGAEAWLRRWIANFEGSPDDIAILEDAIKIVQARVVNP